MPARSTPPFVSSVVEKRSHGAVAGFSTGPGANGSGGCTRIAPLERWRDALAADGRVVPHFDPLDGGVEARVLLLLETPGAGMTGADAVSRDNPSGTSRNLLRFSAEAGLGREVTVVWNVVPWVVHEPGARNRPLRRGELREGLLTVPALLAHLPLLRAAVLLGRPASAAEPVIRAERPDLPVLTAPHPSPTIVCTHPSVGERIAAALRAAKNFANPCVYTRTKRNVA